MTCLTTWYGHEGRAQRGRKSDQSYRVEVMLDKGSAHLLTRLWEYKDSPGRLTLRVLARDPLSSSLQHPPLWTLLAVSDLPLLPFARVARSGRSGS